MLAAASIFVAAAPAGAASQQVRFSLTPIYFGDVVIGTSSSGESIVTNNSGASLYYISAGPSTGDTGAEFHASQGTCVGALAVGASCDVDVVFAPNTHGLRASTLTVRFGEKNAKGKFNAEASFHTTIQGHGVKPTFSLSGGSAGNVVIDQIGTAYATITNTSPVALSLRREGLQGVVGNDFHVASNTCPSPLLPGGSCAVVVNFKPHRTGSASVTLSVAMHLAGTPNTLVVEQSTLSGNGERAGGQSPPFTLSPLGFGTVTVGTTASGEVVLTNTSKFSQTFDGALLQADDSGAYVIVSNNCPAPISAGSSCDITVDYTPAAPVTHNSDLVAKVTFVNAKGKTVSPTAQASLTGRGQVPSFSLKPSSFPATSIGASSSGTVTVTNNSLVPLSYASESFQGADQSSWSFAGSACVNPIQPSQSCELDINFTPLGQGRLTVTFQANLQLTVRGHTTTVYHRTPLSGTGILPTFKLTAPSLGSTPKGVAETGQAVVTNTSSVSLTYYSSGFSGPPNAGDFKVLSTTCSGPIAPTKQCDIVVQFTPSIASPGTESATLGATFAIDGTPVYTSNSVLVTGTES